MELWDAGEGVCCKYFQLGACEHTESFDYEEDDGLRYDATLDPISPLFDQRSWESDPEPF